MTGTVTITCGSQAEYSQTMTDILAQPKCHDVVGNAEALTIQVSITDPPA